MKRVWLVLALLALSGACGKSSTPTTPTPTPTPTPTIVTLTGTVSATGGGVIAGAIVKVLDGPNAGRSATANSVGVYVLDSLTPGNANLSANATIYDEVILGVFINGTNTLNFVFPVPAEAVNDIETPRSK